MHELTLSEAYLRVEKKLLKKYPLAKSSFQSRYEEIAKNPEIGDLIPGFSDCGADVSKTRIGVPRLRMSKSDGFRLVYLTGPKRVVPVFIYKKGHPDREDKILARVSELLVEIFEELSSRQ